MPSLLLPILGGENSLGASLGFSQLHPAPIIRAYNKNLREDQLSPSLTNCLRRNELQYPYLFMLTWDNAFTVMAIWSLESVVRCSISMQGKAMQEPCNPSLKVQYMFKLPSTAPAIVENESLANWTPQYGMKLHAKGQHIWSNFEILCGEKTPVCIISAFRYSKAQNLWSLKRSLSRQQNLGASSSRYCISYALLDVAKYQSFLKAFDETVAGCPILPSRTAKGTTREVVLYGLYPLIWGKAANTRFVPKCICYIFYNLVYELLDLLARNVSIVTGENIKPSYGVDDEEFLRKIMTPLWLVRCTQPFEAWIRFPRRIILIPMTAYCPASHNEHASNDYVTMVTLSVLFLINLHGSTLHALLIREVLSFGDAETYVWGFSAKCLHGPTMTLSHFNRTRLSLKSKAAKILSDSSNPRDFLGSVTASVSSHDDYVCRTRIHEMRSASGLHQMQCNLSIGSSPAVTSISSSSDYQVLGIVLQIFLVTFELQNRGVLAEFFTALFGLVQNFTMVSMLD
ncbi:hypothetical protein VNO77_02431 [Canavalia gladiata]|uniref:1,3-beta-glucan synthase component FKS1-like domain-containing protein n=1 Tax=Canavalia gladiata TaxID=3824 RepID=A0AAN9RBA6_CANGL